MLPGGVVITTGQAAQLTDFSNSTGAPIVVDNTTGLLYVLLTGDVVIPAGLADPARPTAQFRFSATAITSGATRVITIPDRDITLNDLPRLTNSLSGDVSLNNTGTYFDGPSVAQGTAGTWFASGTVVVSDTSVANIQVKLWDGTTVMSSSDVTVPVANDRCSVSVSGFITSPAGNIRISARDITTTAGTMFFNQSGNSKDSTVTAVRIG